MLDEQLLDELIPIENLEEQKRKVIEALEEKNIEISHFEDGSPFGTILMVFFQVKMDLLKLARKIYKGLFIKSAEEKWLDVKAMDYSKSRKKATRTEGVLTIRKLVSEDPLVIPQGYIFKTLPSITGREYRFISTEKIIIAPQAKEGYLPIQAEEAGSAYNVPLNSIKRSLVHIQGLEELTNAEGWMLKEGADEEEDEALRQRTLNSWAELSTQPIALKYKNVAESVEGVLYALVDDMHPRGQGSVDIIIASYAGTAGEKLLKEVEKACDEIKGTYDNLLVKSAETVITNVEVILYLNQYVSEIGIIERAKGYIEDYFKINKGRPFNVLYTSELIFHVRKHIEDLQGMKVVQPTRDLILEKNKVIVLGNVEVRIERV